MTDDSNDDKPAPPKRRRKPPKGLEGFDTGYPEDQPEPAAEASAPRKQLWREPTGPQSVVVDPALSVDESWSPTPADATGPVAASAPSQPMAAAPSQPISSAPTGPIDSAPSGSMRMAPLASSDPAAFPAYAAASASGGVVTAGASTWSPPPISAADDDLRDAIGAKPKKKKRTRTPPPDVPVDDDLDEFAGGGGRRRSRKMIVVSILSLIVGLGVAAIVFLGRQNSSWFYLTCEADKIVAQRGRAFPPWGESALEGKQWAPIKIPPEAECIPLETEYEDEVSTQFRAALMKRASVLLTAKEVTKTDEANALLEQALLHARANTDDARNARAEIQRLLGDVAYWRASLRMRDASKTLLEAAKQFDAAAQQRPRHVTDASAWAEYVRKVVGELEAGPNNSPATVFPPAPPPDPSRPPAPPGVALPVEPDKAGSAAEPAPPPTPDAGLPTGGVLL